MGQRYEGDHDQHMPTNLKLIFLVTILLCIAASPAKALNCDAPFSDNLTYAELKEVINRCQIKTVEALIKALPAEYRKNFVGVYASRSPEKDSVHDLKPRIILFGNDAHLMLAFTGDSKDLKDFSNVQIIESDKSNAKSELHEIEFPQNANRRGLLGSMIIESRIEQKRDTVVYRDNPTSCKTCHGQDPHPIWDPYPLWPGVFHSESAAAPGERERLAIALFHNLTPKVSDPRYGQLSSVKERAPEKLTELLFQQNVKRIVRQLKSSPLYPQMRIPLLRALIGCELFQVPQTTRKQVREKLLNHRKAFYARQKSLTDSEPNHITFDEENGEDLYQLQHIADLLGVSTEEWSLTLEKSSFHFTQPLATGATNALTQGIVLELLSEMPEMTDSSFLTTSTYALPNVTANKDYLCSKVSRKPLNDAQCKIASECQPVSVFTKDNINTLKTTVKAPQAIIAEACMGCHGSEGKHPIPLDEPAKLKKIFGENGKILNSFKKRLQSSGSDRMPPSDFLDQEDRTALLRYFEAL